MINSTLCYIEKDGQYLMLHRTKKERDVNAGKWIGVGGKFEDGESPVDCLKREILEETGLKLTSYLLRGIVTFVSDIAETEYMYLFTSDGFEGELDYGCEEGDLKWIPKEKVTELNLWEGDRVFLKMLLEDAPFFMLKLQYEGDRLAGYTVENRIAI